MRLVDKIKNLDLANSQELAEAKKLIIKDNQQETAALLIENVADELSKNPIERNNALEERDDLLSTLAAYVRVLDEKPLPPFEAAPSLEEVDAYEMEFLIDGWMPADCLTILTGPGGIGKSYLSLQYICALAMGVDANPYALLPSETPLLGHDPIKIVIATYEEQRLEVWKRIKRICSELQWPDYDELSEQIQYVDLQGLGPAWGVATGDHLALRSKMLPIGEYLLDQTAKQGARLLVLDPSAAVYGGSEIARESVREFTSAINAWSREIGCATLLIAHPPKSGDDYAGSTDWLGSCRAMWTLRVEEETTGTGENKETHKWYQLNNITKNYAPPQAPIFLRKISYQDGGYTPVWTPCRDQQEAERFFKGYHQYFEHDDSKRYESEVMNDTKGETDLYADAFLQ